MCTTSLLSLHFSNLFLQIHHQFVHLVPVEKNGLTVDGELRHLLLRLKELAAKILVILAKFAQLSLLLGDDGAKRHGVAGTKAPTG